MQMLSSRIALQNVTRRTLSVMTSRVGAGQATGDPNWWQRAVRSGCGQAIRWRAVLGLVLWRWAAGLPSGFAGWLPVLVVALLLLLPDADSVAFAGVRLEMRRSREEAAALRQQVTQLQMTQARAAGIGAFNVTTENPAVARELRAAIGLTAQTAASERSEIEPYDPGHGGRLQPPTEYSRGYDERGGGAGIRSRDARQGAARHPGHARRERHAP
jgi:hypothetical protein